MFLFGLLEIIVFFITIIKRGKISIIANVIVSFAINRKEFFFIQKNKIIFQFMCIFNFNNTTNNINRKENKKL